MTKKSRRMRRRRLRSRIRTTSARPSWKTAEPSRSAVEVLEAVWLAEAAVDRDDARFSFKGPPARSFRAPFGIRRSSYTVPLATDAPHRPFALEVGTAGLVLNAAVQAVE